MDTINLAVFKSNDYTCVQHGEKDYGVLHVTNMGLVFYSYTQYKYVQITNINEYKTISHAELLGLYMK